MTEIVNMQMQMLKVVLDKLSLEELLIARSFCDGVFAGILTRIFDDLNCRQIQEEGNEKTGND